MLMKSLKILQQNVWDGRIKDGLSRFIAEGDYDVVCLQEAVWADDDIGFLDLYIDSVDKIKKLGGFEYDARAPYYGIKLLDGHQIERGIAILSKVPIIKVEEDLVFGKYAVASSADNFKEVASNHSYPVLKVTLEDGPVILNYHGYWLTDPLGDETTVECMHRVANMLRNETLPVVMCGDLNVIAESPAMRELDFLTDLTAENHLKTTLRNVRFVKDVPCDHILINDKVTCREFTATDVPVSDHKGLVLQADFSML